MQECSISEWDFIINRYTSTKVVKPKNFIRLKGNGKNHPRLGNGTITSTTEVLDYNNGIAQTLNTLYTLEEPSEAVKRTLEKLNTTVQDLFMKLMQGDEKTTEIHFESQSEVFNEFIDSIGGPEEYDKCLDLLLRHMV